MVFDSCWFSVHNAKFSGDIMYFDILQLGFYNS